MMKNNVRKIWENLINDKSESAKMLFRRYSPEINRDIFCTIEKPENYIGLSILINDNINIDAKSIPKLRDIQIEMMVLEDFSKKNSFIMKLLTIHFIDIFSVLCEDLISEIKDITGDKLLIEKILNRISGWQALFERAESEGLSNTEQSGLYGELFFLRMFLKKSNNHFNAINSWRGPEKENTDFQIDNCGIEIKSTTGNNHQKLIINSERQLDTSRFNFLFLFHLSLEKKQHSGESLNDIIEEIFEILQFSYKELNLFRTKLILYGYNEQQKSLYDNTGYTIRNQTFYNVKDKFPRIEEKDLRNGVGDLKYTIIISDFDYYIIDENEVFNIIK